MLRPDTGPAKMTQPKPRSSLCPRVFIYSLPCVLCLQIFLLAGGIPREGCSSPCGSLLFCLFFCLTRNCLFESQLKTNLVQGFLCPHKGTLQEPGRGSENSFSGTILSCKSCLGWFSPFDSYSVSPVQQSNTAAPLSPILTSQDVICSAL